MTQDEIRLERVNGRLGRIAEGLKKYIDRPQRLAELESEKTLLSAEKTLLELKLTVNV